MKSKTRINKFLPFLLAAVLCTFILSTSSCGMLFTKFVNEMTEKSNDADNAGETLLPTPTGLAVTAVTETSVSLSWNPVKNEKNDFQYIVYYGDSNSVDKMSKNYDNNYYNNSLISCKISNLHSNTLYYFRVCSCRIGAHGEYDVSPVSDYISATTAAAVSPKMVLVEGGTFNNGTSDLTVGSFYIGAYELTQGEYEKYCSYGGNSPNSDYGDGSSYPAYNVNWYDAIVYCNKRSIVEGLTPCYSINGNTNPASWESTPSTSNTTWDSATCNWSANGYRLPTEAEWEYAARGGTNHNSYVYSGSDSIDDVAWYKVNAYDVGETHADYGTHIVGTKTANMLGLYDMSGNVEEWCWDWFGTYASTAQTNPHGPSSGNVRTLRGGNWQCIASNCNVKLRKNLVNYPWYRGSLNSIGFRVARSAGGNDETTILVTNISLPENAVTLKTGDTYTLSATVSPSTATNSLITWSSSNINVATVSPLGLVTAIAEGSAIITATATDGSGESTSCTVTVNLPVYQVSFDLNYTTTETAPEAQSITKGGTATQPIAPTRSFEIETGPLQFTGWYTDSKCTNLFDFSTIITSEITLYAGWETYFYESAKPTNVRIVETSTNSVTLSWDSEQSSFNIYYNSENNPANANQFNSDFYEKTATVTGLNSNTTYYFWISCSGGGGISESAYSDMVSGKTNTEMSISVTLASTNTADIGLTNTDNIFTANTGFSSYWWYLDAALKYSGAGNTYTFDFTDLSSGNHTVTLLVDGKYSATALVVIQK